MRKVLILLSWRMHLSVAAVLRYRVPCYNIDTDTPAVLSSVQI